MQLFVRGYFSEEKSTDLWLAPAKSRVRHPRSRSRRRRRRRPAEREEEYSTTVDSLTSSPPSAGRRDPTPIPKRFDYLSFEEFFERRDLNLRTLLLRSCHLEFQLCPPSS